MALNIFKRISYAGKSLFNSYPNEIVEADVDKSEPLNKCAVDFFDTAPSKVRRTVKNRRFATRDPQVQGILLDLMTKTNGVFEIKGDNSRALNHIMDMSVEWDLDTLIDNALWKGFVDSQGYLHTRIVDNHVRPRWLTYDGKTFDIKELYDEEGELLGYKQIIIKNVHSNKGFIKKKFDALDEDNDVLELNYTPDEIIHFKYLERDGRPHSLMDSILDDVYYKRVLKELMPLSVYKSSNIVKVTMGNEVKSNKRLTKEARDNVADTFNNYHKKGCVILPFGIDAELMKAGSLPEIQDYLKYYESCIYVGLNTPEAIFSSESSNRATADIQLDSPTTGRVLFLEYNREWVKKYLNKLFKKELELQGINGEVWIDFETEELTDEEIQAEETDPESLHKPITKKGQEDTDKTDNNSIKKKSNKSKTSNKNSSTNKNHDVPNTTNKQSRKKRSKS